jgi:hypothetical protein
MTITDDDIYDYMEHHGVKGMHWGVRKQRTSGSTEKVEGTSKKKRAAQIAVIAGVVIAGGIIAHKAGVRVPSIRGPSTSSGSAKSADILKKVGQEKFSAIPMPPIGGFSRPRVRQTTSASGDIKALRASIATSIKLANADLRARDNKNNVPFAMRSYIPEWT